MTRAHWLLEVQIGGRVYRYSEDALEVTTAAGEVLVFDPGLDDPGDQEVEADSVEVSLVDPEVDWPALARRIEGGDARLLFHTEGDVYELAEVICVGLAAAPEWGSRFDAVSFGIVQLSGADQSLGRRLTADDATVSTVTWPAGDGGASALNTFADPDDANQFRYPLLFGYPGYTGSGGTVYMPVQVPLAQWRLGVGTYAVVSEDVDAPITSCWIRDDEADTEIEQDVLAQNANGTPVQDLLGRQVRVADLWSQGYDYFPSGASTILYAGFSPDGGGGAARSAYDVLVYVLRRWGDASVDWTRLPEIRDFLGQFMVDTWVGEQAPDPWEWLQATFLNDIPQVEIRQSVRGRYLVHRPRTTTGREVRELVADDGDVVRTSSVGLTSATYNQFVAFFRGSREGSWLGKVELHGDTDRIRNPSAEFATAQQQTYQVYNQRCASSRARFGLRQDPSQRAIDWTWDEGTVVRVLELQAEESALPSLGVEYRITDAADLHEGDEVTITDDELGWNELPALIDRAIVRGRDSSVLALRIPEAG